MKWALATLLVVALALAGTGLVNGQTSPGPGAPPYRSHPDGEPAPACCSEPSNQTAWKACREHATSNDQQWKCTSEYCHVHSDAYCAYYCWKYDDPACPPSSAQSGEGSGPDGNGTANHPADSTGRNGTSGPSNRAPPNPCAQEATPEGKRSCVERFCSDHPGDPRCACLRDPTCRENACREHPKARPCTDVAWCADARPCPAFADFKAHVQHPVQFDLLRDRSGLANYTVGGVLALRSLTLSGNATPEMQRSGAVLKVRLGHDRLEIHDEPGGLIAFRGETATATFFLPLDATWARAPHGAEIHYAGGARALLLAENTTWAGASVTVRGFASFHLVGMGKLQGDALDARMDDALDRRHLGAKVQIHPANDGPADVVPYEDMRVHVVVPGVNGSAVVRVDLQANLTEGRTVVLDLDPDVLATTDSTRLSLRYYDVHDDGTETEVVFRAASDLTDVLDPTNDKGQPEYWVVSDGAGLHVMVSVPHWSAHAVTLGSIALPIPPTVLVGLAAGAGASVIAALALFWPRRRA